MRSSHGRNSAPRRNRGSADHALTKRDLRRLLGVGRRAGEEIGGAKRDSLIRAHELRERVLVARSRALRERRIGRRSVLHQPFLHRPGLVGSRRAQPLAGVSRRRRRAPNSSAPPSKARATTPSPTTGSSREPPSPAPGGPIATGPYETCESPKPLLDRHAPVPFGGEDDIGRVDARLGRLRCRELSQPPRSRRRRSRPWA